MGPVASLPWQPGRGLPWRPDAAQLPSRPRTGHLIKARGQRHGSRQSGADAPAGQLVAALPDPGLCSSCGQRHGRRVPGAGRGAACCPHPSCQPLRPGFPAGAPGRRPWAEPCFSGAKSAGAQATQARPCPRRTPAPRTTPGPPEPASQHPTSPHPRRWAPPGSGDPASSGAPGSPVSLLSRGRPSSLVTELGLTPRPLPEPPRPPARRQLPRSQHRAGILREARARARSQPGDAALPGDRNGSEPPAAESCTHDGTRRTGRRRRHQAAAVSPSQRDTGAAARPGRPGPWHLRPGDQKGTRATLCLWQPCGWLGVAGSHRTGLQEALRPAPPTITHDTDAGHVAPAARTTLHLGPPSSDRGPRSSALGRLPRQRPPPVRPEWLHTARQIGRAHV